MIPVRLLTARPWPLIALSTAIAMLVLGVPVTAHAEGDPVPGESVRGELVQAWVEHEGHESTADEADAGLLTWVETDAGESVRLSTDDVTTMVGDLTGDPAADVPVGATVQVVVGDEVAGAVDEEGLEPAREVLAAEMLEAAPADEVEPVPAEEAPATVTNEVTVVMMVPLNGAVETGRTLQQVLDAVNGPVSTYWADQTGGTVRIGTAVTNYDWAQAGVACSDVFGLWREAAGRANWTGGPGKHLLVYLPRNSAGCSYGLAELGSSTASGGRLYVTDVATSVIAHELGHNFGLGHSGGRQCDRDTETGSCRDVDYRDYYDIMGISGPWAGELNASHATRLGVLPAEQRAAVTAPATSTVHTLVPFVGGVGTRAIRLTDSGGVEYWLEYRMATRWDAWLATNTNVFGLQQGVLLRRSDPVSRGTALLDGTPSPSAQWDDDMQTALPVGVPVRLAGGGFTVTVRSLTTEAATVLVQGEPVSPFPRDWTGERDADLLAADGTGGLQLYPGSGTGGFLGRRTIGSGWGARDQLLMSGDWDGDTFPDLIARNPVNGDLWLYRGNGAGGFLSWRVIGVGWGVMDALISPGDWNGDGRADLLARQRSDGSLFLYPGNGSGGFGAPSRVGAGWQVMTDLAASGDWDRNGVVDLIARDGAGYLHLYSGNGTGGFTGGRRTIGVGWNAFAQITGPGDWNGDGNPDLLAQASNGALFLYPGSGNGGFLGARQIGSGWTGFRLPD